MTGRLVKGTVVKGTVAWVAGTAVAVTLAWLGAGVVLRNAVGDGPQVPVLSAPAPAPSGPAGVVGPGAPPSAGSPSPARPRRDTPSPSPSVSPGAGSPAPSQPAPASPPGTVHSYVLAGGRVTLLFARASAQLVTATPSAGFAVQTWSAAGWLRVDFSSGPDVSSLIATWNGHAPSVQIFD
jgi:hypothetical protein